MGLFDFLAPTGYRPAWDAEHSTLVAIRRTPSAPRIVEEFVPDGYRGTVFAAEPEPSVAPAIESVIFTTFPDEETAGLCRVDFHGGLAAMRWSVDVHRGCAKERLFARRGDVFFFPRPVSGLQAISLTDGRLVWSDGTRATLATSPRLLDNGVVRCGMTDGTVIDVDLESTRTVARVDASKRAGALWGGRSLALADHTAVNSVWLEEIQFQLVDGELRGRGKPAARPAGFVVSPPILIHGRSVVAWMTRARRDTTDVAVGFFDSKTLACEELVEVSGSRDGSCLSALVVDDVLCARVLADDVTTLLVDLRTRAIVGVLHHHTSDRSGILSAEGDCIFSGRL